MLQLKRWQLKKSEIESKVQTPWQKKAPLKTEDDGDLKKESVLIDAKCLLETDYYFENGISPDLNTFELLLG